MADQKKRRSGDFRTYEVSGTEDEITLTQVAQGFDSTDDARAWIKTHKLNRHYQILQYKGDWGIETDVKVVELAGYLIECKEADDGE